MILLGVIVTAWLCLGILGGAWLCTRTKPIDLRHLDHAVDRVLDVVGGRKHP